ncbi:MAG: hypothetical protein K8H88_04090, partial [Sandaracinaceae bacterium]|nr:hypothetical protein [Sandaracinaceae bacterium]
MADDPAPQDALALSAPEGAALALRQAFEHAQAFADAARSERTRDAYRYQWARFEVWCEAHALVPLPASPATVALYLSAWESEAVSVATLAQAQAAIAKRSASRGTRRCAVRPRYARCGRASAARSASRRGATPSVRRMPFHT